MYSYLLHDKNKNSDQFEYYLSYNTKKIFSRFLNEIEIELNNQSKKFCVHRIKNVKSRYATSSLVPSNNDYILYQKGKPNIFFHRIRSFSNGMTLYGLNIKSIRKIKILEIEKGKGKMPF